MEKTFIVFLGPPGAGKGTQALIVAQAFGLAHISTGDLFRDNIARGTVLGLQAKAANDAGLLVSDDITNGMVYDRLQKSDVEQGAVMDGYPRTVVQADAFTDMLQSLHQARLTAAIQLVVSEAELVRRILGRAEAMRALGKAPRVDDTEAGARERYRVYSAETAPLVDYFQARNCLVAVDGERPIDIVAVELLLMFRQRGWV